MMTDPVFGRRNGFEVPYKESDLMLVHLCSGAKPNLVLLSVSCYHNKIKASSFTCVSTNQDSFYFCIKLMEFDFLGRLLPRPENDVEYLHGILESIARIEVRKILSVCFCPSLYEVKLILKFFMF